MPVYNDNRRLGTDIMLHKIFKAVIIEFNAISERMYTRNDENTGNNN